LKYYSIPYIMGITCLTIGRVDIVEGRRARATAGLRLVVVVVEAMATTVVVMVAATVAILL
jgi:hypothetical protein